MRMRPRMEECGDRSNLGSNPRCGDPPDWLLAPSPPTGKGAGKAPRARSRRSPPRRYRIYGRTAEGRSGHLRPLRLRRRSVLRNLRLRPSQQHRPGREQVGTQGKIGPRPSSLPAGGQDHIPWDRSGLRDHHHVPMMLAMRVWLRGADGGPLLNEVKDLLGLEQVLALCSRKVPVDPSGALRAYRALRLRRRGHQATTTTHPRRRFVEVGVDHRRHVERHELGEREAPRPPRVRAAGATQHRRRSPARWGGSPSVRPSWSS